MKTAIKLTIDHTHLEPKTYTMSIKETIIKLEKERDFFPKGTGFYQKYQNAINALNKMKKYQYNQTYNQP
jgi:hypothetical protein